MVFTALVVEHGWNMNIAVIAVYYYTLNGSPAESGGKERVMAKKYWYPLKKGDRRPGEYQFRGRGTRETWLHGLSSMVGEKINNRAFKRYEYRAPLSTKPRRGKKK
jgi:hypothetical protein